MRLFVRVIYRIFSFPTSTSHLCFSADADAVDNQAVKVKAASSVFVSPSAGVLRHSLANQISSSISFEGETSGLQHMYSFLDVPYRIFRFRSSCRTALGGH